MASKIGQRIQPGVSKFFERLMHEQIRFYMDQFLSLYTCGYRKGFCTQHARLSLIEKGKKVVDNKGYSGAILMDLSKTFDTINDDLFIAKLHVYGFSRESLKLIKSHLTNRWQRTKLNTIIQVLRYEKSPSCAQTC